MKATIKFGFSTTRIGALNITNYRIRTNTDSNLDKMLYKAWDEICERIHDEDRMYTDHNVRLSQSRTGYYSIHDFTTCCHSLFIDVMLPIIKRNMLDAELLDLNDKYKSLNVMIRQEVLPTQEEYNLECP